MSAAVFLDRDGTINMDTGYVYKPEDFRFLPRVPEAIRVIKEKGYLVIVVTNQSGVARGYFTEADVEKLHSHMRFRLNEAGADIDDIYYCPHLPGGSEGKYAVACLCRKPGTLMFEQAIMKHGIDPALSYAVGDRPRDLEPGKRLGMRTALISQGEHSSPAADKVYPSLYEFARSL